MSEIVQIPALKDNYNYLLHDAGSGETAVVDPSEAEPILNALDARGWKLTAILNTHHHWDHTGGNKILKRKTGCEIYGYGPDADRIPGIDHHLEEGDLVRVGESEADVLFIPGHTLGHIAYYFPKEKALFSGDTIFGMGCGRLFEGTPAQMLASFNKLAALPDDTFVYSAHEYTQANGRFVAAIEPENPDLLARRADVKAKRKAGKPSVPFTLAEEKATNPFFRTHSDEIRRNLHMEKASDEAVFAEIRARKDAF